MRPRNPQLLAAGVSLLASALLAWWAASRLLRDGDSVRVVDTGNEVAALLEARRADPGAARVPGVLDEELAALFYPVLEHRPEGYVFDPAIYVRRLPPDEPVWIPFAEHPDGGYWRSYNAQGMREDEDAGADGHGPRVLVVGDSHTEGVVANDESFANLLESSLRRRKGSERAEVFNAGLGYYNFYNYRRVLDRYGWLEPDVLVVTVYGGNDFSGAVVLRRFFDALPAPALGPLRPPWKDAGNGIGPQVANQITYFANNPGDVELAVDTGVEVCLELVRRAEQAGVEVVFVYLPDAFEVQPALYPGLIERMRALLGATDASVSTRLADGWIEGLAAAGVPVLDLRPAFRAADQRLYWERDLHLAVAGHRRVAGQLLERVLPLLGSEDPR